MLCLASATSILYYPVLKMRARVKISPSLSTASFKFSHSFLIRDYAIYIQKMMKTVLKGRNYRDQTDETQSTSNSPHSCSSFYSHFGYFPYISFHFCPLASTQVQLQIFLFDLNRNESKISVQMKADFPNIGIEVSCGHIIV